MVIKNLLKDQGDVVADLLFEGLGESGPDVIDHEGVIRYKWAGAPGEKVMDAALDKLIRAAEETGK